MSSEGYNNLLQKINKREAKIGVIGLGYVGLPLAVLFAKKGYTVTGFIRNENKLQGLRSGKNLLSDPILDRDLQSVLNGRKLYIDLIDSISFSNQDVYIICVPTPVRENKTPDLADLISVAEYLSHINVSDKLIVNESTVAPFTTRDMLGNFKNKYFLVCSPERIDPGNKDKDTENIPKVMGGINKESVTLASMLYKQILKHKVVQVSSLEAAEMTKMLENTYRAVNIGLINEFAKLADACGIDILEVVNAARTKWSFHSHYPSIGVGGHCIPVDPYYILSLAKHKNISMNVVAEGLAVNEEMPMYLVDKVAGIYKKGMSVLVYGLTYKKDVPDLRESPAVVFCNMLKKRGIIFGVYDPYISEDKVIRLGFIPAKLKKCDIFIVATDHSQLYKDYKNVISKTTLVVDGKNFFVKKQGIKVIGVGRTLL